jgi:hypothetical protein
MSIIFGSKDKYIAIVRLTWGALSKTQKIEFFIITNGSINPIFK